jgi:hypothetical protein
MRRQESGSDECAVGDIASPTGLRFKLTRRQAAEMVARTLAASVPSNPLYDVADALLVVEHTEILSDNEVELASLILEALAKERAEILPENRHAIGV